MLNDLFGTQLILDKSLVDDKIGLWIAIPDGRTYNEVIEYLDKVCKLELQSSPLSEKNNIS